MKTKEERLLSACQLVLDAAKHVKKHPKDMEPDIYGVFDALFILNHVVKQIKAEILKEEQKE